MMNGLAIDCSDVASFFFNLCSDLLVHDISEEIELLQTGSETIATSGTNDNISEIYVNDCHIDEQMRGMKNYINNKFTDMKESTAFNHYGYGDSIKQMTPSFGKK